jgi:predicted RNA-binding Zn ribbon-like protein
MLVRAWRTLRRTVFDLDGGRLCLDFANTLSQRTGEHLVAYVDLLAFAQQSGVLTQAKAERLQARAERRPHEATLLMARVREVRAAVYALFSAVAAGREPAPADVETFNAALGSALSHARLATADDGFVWEWAGGRAADLEAPLWDIVRSAADLLTSPDVGKVRECGGVDCRWLFMDTSKNRSRQWCSMSSCGNREKARRHYERVRARQEPRASATPSKGATRPSATGRAG